MTHPARHLAAILPLATSLCLALAGCGGGDASAPGDGSSPADSGGTPTSPVADCLTTAYQAGSVVAPTLDEIARYAATYDGEEGSYDAQFKFVATGAVSVVVAADGAVRYGGQDYPVTSVCLDKVAGPYGRLLYLIVGQGHLDISPEAQADLGAAWGVSPKDGTTIFTGGQR